MNYKLIICIAYISFTPVKGSVNDLPEFLANDFPDVVVNAEVEEKASIVSYESLLGEYSLQMPKKNKSDDQIILRKSYICSYNKSNRCANWSGWHLTKEHADGPYTRKGLKIKSGYLEDGDNLSNKQYLSDWVGTSGYDHGHMCPSGDNKWDIEAMRQTFFLSNICVQNSQLNQGPWERLESICREWAKTYGEVYIICGPIFYDNDIRKVGENLPVPDAFFKVVYRPSPEPISIAFVYSNTTPDSNDKLESHVTTVDAVELLTGYDFFWSLPDNIENKIESESDILKWRVR